jgi:predicted phage tail protein
VTVNFASSVVHPDIRIAEYRGLATTSPVDVVATSSGSGTSSSSGSVTTTNANDLLVGANMVSTTTTGAGQSFTNRVITQPDGDILEDRIVTSAGSYSASAPLDNGSWIMQMVAFKAGPVADTQAPTTPTGLTANAVTSSQINLSWTASTDNVGVTGYEIDRCQGSGCTNYAQVGTSSTASFSNTGLSASTTYRYRVRAVDAAANESGNSSSATATTPAPPDTQAPTAPAMTLSRPPPRRPRSI